MDDAITNIEDKPETMPGLTVCMFGVFSKVLTQLFCGVLPRPPNGAIGAMPAEICQKSKQLMKMNGQKKFWLRFCNSQDRTKVELTIANEAWTDCYH